jgi:hypothetical protein
VTAHVAGIPVEELLPLLTGAGAVWFGLRAYAARLREKMQDRRPPSR